MPAHPALRPPRAARLGKLVLVTLLLGAVLAVVPRPAFAIEKGMRVDSETPTLTPIERAPVLSAAERDDHADGDEHGPGDEHETDAASGTGAPATERRLRAEAEGIDEFEMIGATFAAEDLDGGSVRVSIDGEWAPWQPLTNLDGEHGPDPDSEEGRNAKPASDPIWVGDGDGYELDLPGDATGVEVHLVRETEERVRIVDGTEEAGAYQMPSIRSRASWGARAPRDPTEFADTVDLAVIHHTVNSNAYSASSVPAMIRSIQSYHMDANGWSDIGYNFVVDRFGNRWEGRNQSTYRATIGAHSKGSNTGSTGIAWLGDGTGAGLTGEGHESISKIIAWKLPLHGTFFTGSQIVGHRDRFSTSCPGNAIYNQLGSIRSRAGALRPPPGPFLDVPHTAWNGPEILWGKYLGIATGYPDGNFRPTESLIRAQFVNMMWGLVGKPPASTQHGFTDVPRSSFLTPALDWAKEAGIVTGYPDGSFRGNNTMRRDTISVLLWRWATSPAATTPHGFSDISATNWADDAIAWAKEAGVVSGYPNNTFRPANDVQRGQVLPMLYDLRPFTDVPPTSWYHPGAHWSLHQGISLGYADRTFRSTTDVDRSQGTSMLWRMMDRPTSPAPPPHGFSDVAAGAWYETALNWATDAGWVEGKIDGDFHGRDPMLRHTVALWIWRTAGSPAATTSHGYSDVPGGAAYNDALDWAAEHGIVTGYPDNTFRPDEKVSRAQWIMMLHRLATTPAAWTGGATPPSTTLF